MFDMFKKKSPEQKAREKRIKELKLRKIGYMDDNHFDDLMRGMRGDGQAWLKLKPVNYHASKKEYLMGKVYTNEDFSENYVCFERISQERCLEKSEIYSVDYDILSKALSKVGIIISRPGEQSV